MKEHNKCSCGRYRATGYNGELPYVWAHDKKDSKPYIKEDGIGRLHMMLYANCDYCGEKFRYAEVHLDHLVRCAAESPYVREKLLSILNDLENKSK